MDEIRIDNLEIFGYHGVYATEKEKGQRFYVNAVLFLDTSKAGRTDDLSLSVNYGEVCHKLTDWFNREKVDLLETVAERLAERLLWEFPLLSEVELEIRKPQAPIGLPFESVSVRIRRGWHQAYLSIGSNIGDREGYLLGAVDALKNCAQIRNLKVSTFLETKPYGGVEQDDFLNGAVALETTLSPSALLELLHQIEAKADRKREVHWGPRTLDLDILFYDKLVYEDAELIIPHVDLENREFVLKPLKELAPNYRHPILGRTVTQMLADLEKCAKN
ncbi:MAG: 2-amino-4-hydroxy-6-hydroxymethyldihydropteridine diphosphokinase [Lachnospiraceae bacterium]|nr:2-amino-4-hydroxy-6-hydroxymethyldihydropteridine diphosphokinase [Lachnospiraceae bacterium]